MAESDKVSCQAPNCPVGGLMLDVAEIKSDLKDLTKEAREFLKVVANIQYLSHELSELRKDSKESDDELFKRVRDVENNKLGKNDVIMFGTMMTIIFGVISFAANYIFKVG